MRLLIMGPPGAGKGTQAGGIADRYKVPAVSSGDLFRAHIKAQDELGKRVSEIIAKGEFVPDEVTTAMVFERIDEADAASGWLLDGYPRTLGQVAALDEKLAGQGASLDAVISLVADPDELVGRMLKRAQEQGRADDNEETIRRRIEVYGEETKPVLDAYAARDLVVSVDALGAVDEVTARIVAALDEKVGR